MAIRGKTAFAKLLAGASVVAVGCSASSAFAQEDVADEAVADGDVIIVTGIRASLRESMNIKRNAQGVVDAISAEDIGKFPDTNLAESMQRITGVSIDRSNGEGSKVTVRGMGPEFNLVLLNGRQMPASGLGSCCEAPASRSFDFANLASEGVASLEVYKSGRATLPSGGIGSVINIRTPKPLDRGEFEGSIGVKAVMDHSFDGTDITPEISGIVSKTFANDTLGILVSGAYQKRKGSLASFSAGWREGYDGADSNSWGSLPPPEGDWRGNRVENHPDAGDIYQTPQNAAYDFTNFSRERINGQAVLQWAPSDQFEAAIDYTYSQYTLDARTSSIGVWFNHDQTSSSWTDGPVAGANFYAENFGAGKDMAITGAVAANRNVNRSLGGNLKWNHPSGWRWELDAHHSIAESKPTSPYGSNIAVGTAIYGVESQIVDFTTDMPVISAVMYPGSEILASNIRPSGNAFRNGYMKDRINEVRLSGGYDFDQGFIESLDFGVTYTDNKVRTAYGFLQTDSWGGTLTAAQTPDDFFTLRDLPEDLSGMNGSQSPDILQNYFTINTEALISLLNDELGICTSPWVGTPTGEGCLAQYSVDRRINERTLAPYLQTTHAFDLLADEAHLTLGLRYEVTDIVSSGLVPTPTGTSRISFNEIAILYDNAVDPVFTTAKGSYDNWLPAIDFDFTPIDDVVLRASYSHTITRPSYNDLQGGLTVNSPGRVAGASTGQVGNPGLLPYKSKNIDLSAEWYYGNSSYISVGYFNKKVQDYIGTSTYQSTEFGLLDPTAGAISLEAIAGAGANACFLPDYDASATTCLPGTTVIDYVVNNYPDAVQYDGDGLPIGILSQPGDPLLNFNITQPNNSDQKATLDGWEFAIQHNFWETGIGVILNYTIVNSNTSYDLLRPAFSADPQFAVTGVSDSANAVLFYDKNGLQARVAYNWRDGFLSNYGNDPFFVESYGQFDVSASYEFDNGISIFAEGINITNADRRGHMRADEAVYFAAPGYARYAAGMRFTF